MPLFRETCPAGQDLPLSDETTERRVRVIILEDLCEEAVRVKNLKVLYQGKTKLATFFDVAKIP